MKNTRNQLFGVVSTMQAGAMGLRNAVTERFGIAHGTALDWALLVGFVTGAAFSSKWLYYKVLWRFMKSSIDLNGTWRYDSSYSESYIAAFARKEATGQAERYKLQEKGSTGRIRFKQDLDSITLSGSSSRSAAGNLTARTLSIEFNETDTLELIFEVTAYSRTTPGAHFSYRQLETMKIEKRGRWFLWLKRPTMIIGEFRTSLLSEGELEQAQYVWPGWVPTMGSATYHRLSKNG